MQINQVTKKKNHKRGKLLNQRPQQPRRFQKQGSIADEYHRKKITSKRDLLSYKRGNSILIKDQVEQIEYLADRSRWYFPSSNSTIKSIKKLSKNFTKLTLKETTD